MIAVAASATFKPPDEPWMTIISRTRIADTNGLPSTMLNEATAPIIMTRSCCSGRIRAANTAAIMLPRAISGASGPSTAPIDRLISAATRIEKPARGSAPMDNPPSGLWPPPPGSRRANQTPAEPATSTSRIHQ